MNYYIYGYTDKGKHLNDNEDCILMNHYVLENGRHELVCTAPFLAAVCDGVGGEKSGDLASELCSHYLSEIDFNTLVNLDFEIIKIHNKIIKKGISSDEAINMQTTLCCLAVDDKGSATCYNVGDSRMYRYVDGCARQISIDQTYSKFLYEKGDIDNISDVEPSMQSAIISSIGSVSQEPTIDHTDFVTLFGSESDDLVIICSDGFSDFITIEEIEIAMRIETMTLKEKLDALCELAIRKGGKDNISIVGIKPFQQSSDIAI